jgi:hypothetical protein
LVQWRHDEPIRDDIYEYETTVIACGLKQDTEAFPVPILPTGDTRDQDGIPIIVIEEHGGRFTEIGGSSHKDIDEVRRLVIGHTKWLAERKKVSGRERFGLSY